ncbi:molybdenum cofactor guanylyltransferase [Demequina flava]|uniref:molybdenum cofactor guanylyltransferase n=1 Tax=Demequina flava TaxID=1095025 RepID=UPI0007818C75|nr:molybdenum cofactor guanylyltransferase [Demequina flava]
MILDAVILAGGRGSRLGGVDKPSIEVGDATLLDHALAAAGVARARCVVGQADPRPGVPVVREDPPFSGPVAAIAAGMDALAADSDAVLVLACDMPYAAQAVPDLIASLSAPYGDSPDGAWAVDREGHTQPLLAVYRTASLRRAIESLDTVVGASMRRLVADLVMTRVPIERAARDADTWNDVHSLRKEWT